MLKPPIRNTSNFKKFTLLCKKIVNNKLVSARSWQSTGKQCLSCLVLTAIAGLYSRIYPCLVRMIADVGTDVVLVIAMVSCWEHIRTTNSTLVYISGSRSLSKQMFSIDQRALFFLHNMKDYIRYGSIYPRPSSVWKIHRFYGKYKWVLCIL